MYDVQYHELQTMTYYSTQIAHGVILSHTSWKFALQVHIVSNSVIKKPLPVHPETP